LGERKRGRFETCPLRLATAGLPALSSAGRLPAAVGNTPLPRAVFAFHKPEKYAAGNAGIAILLSTLAVVLHFVRTTPTTHRRNLLPFRPGSLTALL